MKKLTRRQLRKMILNEMREDHITGIKRKIAALERELRRQRFNIDRFSMGIPSSNSHGEQLASIEAKLERLKRELDHLVDDTSPAAY